MHDTLSTAAALSNAGQLEQGKSRPLTLELLTACESNASALRILQAIAMLHSPGLCQTAPSRPVHQELSVLFGCEGTVMRGMHRHGQAIICQQRPQSRRQPQRRSSLSAKRQILLTIQA